MNLAGGNVVSHVRLIELVRRERERARRDVDTTANLTHPSLDEQDARLYRCPGCGDWQYRGRTRSSNRPEGRAKCRTCGARLRPQPVRNPVDNPEAPPPRGVSGGASGDLAC